MLVNWFDSCQFGLRAQTVFYGNGQKRLSFGAAIKPASFARGVTSSPALLAFDDLDDDFSRLGQRFSRFPEFHPASGISSGFSPAGGAPPNNSFKLASLVAGLTSKCS